MMVWGPSKQGMDLTTCFSSFDLYLQWRCKVLRWTRWPTSKGKAPIWDLLACLAWEILALSKLSWASHTLWINRSITVCAAIEEGPWNSVGGNCTRGGRTQGLRPRHSWKGENPVGLFTLFMMLKRIRGRALTHPFWLCLTWKRIDWTTVLLECSLLPSVSGGRMLTIWPSPW